MVWSVVGVCESVWSSETVEERWLKSYCLKSSPHATTTGMGVAMFLVTLSFYVVKNNKLSCGTQNPRCVCSLFPPFPRASLTSACSWWCRTGSRLAAVEDPSTAMRAALWSDTLDFCHTTAWNNTVKMGQAIFSHPKISPPVGLSADT